MSKENGGIYAAQAVKSGDTLMATDNELTRRHFLAAATAAGAGLTLTGTSLATAAAEAPVSAAAAPWKAGLAKIAVTPRRSLWMAGFGARKKPSEGTLQELYAKALALEDQSGKRAVLLSSDLVGFSGTVAKNIAEQAERKYRLPRDCLILSSSHTHCGPLIERPLSIWYLDLLSAEQTRDVEQYTRELEGQVVTVIGAALKDLQPARLSFARGQANFAVNRRVKTPTGIASFRPNPDGPVDHDVPLLRVDGPDGRLRAAVFGYAAHPTCLVADTYQFSGDYAGFAQERLEQQHPGMLALFVQGCGADIMVSPRGTIELARKYGEQLASGVDLALGGPPLPVGGPLKTAFEVFPVAFAPPPSREELQARLEGKATPESQRVQEFLKVSEADWRRHARELLKTLDRDGRLPSEYPYPLQVWQFGQDLTLVAMAGEAVVDYALRLKKELGSERLWVAAYSNDVFAYIPSRRVLEEGGYEGGGAMAGARFPGPFAPSVEETIIGKVHELVERVRKE
jgi:hypothetical protein